MDWLIRKAKNSIINLLNEINLPIEIKRLLLVEILAEVTQKAEGIIKEQLELEKESKESEEKADESN